MKPYSVLTRRKQGEFEALLAAIFFYTHSPTIPISLYLLKRAGIVPPDTPHGKSASSTICNTVKDLRRFGFIEGASGSYCPKRFQKRYKPLRRRIYMTLGEERLDELELVLDRLPRPITPSVHETVSPNLGLPGNGLSWALRGPGVIEFYRGDRMMNSVVWKQGWQKQAIHLPSFHGDSEAFRAWFDSLGQLLVEVPGDVMQWVETLNSVRTPTTRIRFEPRLKSKFSGGKRTRLTLSQSARATSEFCLTKRIGEDRERIRKKYGLVQEWDIKSCIPRLDYLLGHGVWLPDEVDLYKVIYGLSGLNQRWSGKVRKQVKDLFMRFRFGGSEKEGWNGYLRHCRTKNKAVFWTEPEFQALHAATYDYLGVRRDTSVFYWESILELDVLKTLHDRGHFVLNVYDGFFFREDLDPRELQAVVDEAAMRVKARFDATEGRFQYNLSSLDVSLVHAWCIHQGTLALKKQSSIVEVGFGKARALMSASSVRSFMSHCRETMERFPGPTYIQAPRVEDHRSWIEKRKKELQDLGMTVYVEPLEAC